MPGPSQGCMLLRLSFDNINGVPPRAKVIREIKDIRWVAITYIFGQQTLLFYNIYISIPPHHIIECLQLIKHHLIHLTSYILHLRSTGRVRVLHSSLAFTQSSETFSVLTHISWLWSSVNINPNSQM